MTTMLPLQTAFHLVSVYNAVLQRLAAIVTVCTSGLVMILYCTQEDSERNRNIGFYFHDNMFCKEPILQDQR